MERVLWIGPKKVPQELKQLLTGEGLEVLPFPSVDQALQSVGTSEVAVAVVSIDSQETLASIPKLVQARPEIQVLAATEVHVATEVAHALMSGAESILNLRATKNADQAVAIRDLVNRFHHRSRERELLMRLRSLNEEFLKHMVAAERRNLELEEQLHPTAEKLASADARVLIVDDEATVCQVLETALGKRGHQYVTVKDGEEAAIALRKQDPFHLVITDKNLPGKSGLEVLKEVKELSPETDVIVMTGYSSAESAIEALNLGATAYLEKPFDQVKAVVEKIEDVLAQQRERVRKRQYLHLIKARNRSFLEQYRLIRADLEAWLQARGYSRKWF